MFPETRLRRFRLNENIRSMVRESRVHADQLIYPIFVVEGEDQINPIGSMPGINQFSLDHLLEEVEPEPMSFAETYYIARYMFEEAIAGGEKPENGRTIYEQTALAASCVF